MMTINRRVKGIFLEHKATYIGIILLIVLSVSCYLGLKTASTSIDKNVIDNRISSNVEDANFKYSGKLTDEEMSVLEKKFDLELQRNRELEYKFNNATLRVRAVSNKINKYTMYDGEALKSDNEIMVDRFFFNAQKLSFGDTIKVGNRNFIVCGMFTTPDYLSVFKSKTDFMCDGSKFGLCIVTTSAFNALLDGEEAVSYSVVFHEDNSEKFRKELSKNGSVLEYISRDANNRITTFDGEIAAIKMISKIAPVFILLVTSLIVAIVIGRILKKEYIYIGTLTAMGYKKSQIVIHYLILPALISIIGAVVGMVAGILLTEPFSAISSVEYNIPRPEFYYKWEDFLVIILLPVALNSAAALISVLKAFKLNIVALLKANAGKQKKGLLTKLIPYKRGPFKLRFKLKEIASNIPRSVVLLIGLIAASIFMLSGFSFNSAIDFLFDSNFHEMFGYEYQYILEQPIVENKTTGEPYIVAGFDYQKDGKIFGLDLNGVARNSKFIKLYDKSGNLIPYGKTVFTESVAKRLDLKKGDKIKLKSNSNLNYYELTVDEICTITYSSNIYLPLSKLNSMLKLPENAYIGLYSDQKLDIDKKLVSNVITLNDSKAGMEAAISSMKAFLYIMALFAAIIGIIVIYIVTVMIIEENRKNISMLKVVGYHNREISRLVINSTSVLVWAAYLISVPLTSILIQAFFNALTKDMYYVFKVNLELWQIFTGLAFILLIYYITLFLTKRKVLNINMAESLKARE